MGRVFTRWLEPPWVVFVVVYRGGSSRYRQTWKVELRGSSHWGIRPPTRDAPQWGKHSYSAHGGAAFVGITT